MPRRTKQEQEQGFMRSFWDEVRMLQADYGAAVGLYAYPTERPSVWSFRLVFTPLIESAENPVGSAAVQFIFPTASNTPLAATLWVQAMKLTQVVIEANQVKRPVQLHRD